MATPRSSAINYDDIPVDEEESDDNFDLTSVVRPVKPIVKPLQVSFAKPRGAKRSPAEQLALNAEIQEELKNRLSEITPPEGWEIDVEASLPVTVKPTADQLKNFKENARNTYSSLTDDQARELIELLDSKEAGYFGYDKGTIVARIITGSTVKFKRPASNTITNIEIDVKQGQSGKLEPQVTEAELADYLKGVSDIEKFAKTHRIPSTVDLNDFKVKIVSNKLVFATLRKKGSRSAGTLAEIANNTFGVNIGFPRLDGSIATVILFNNSLLRENRTDGVKFVTRMSDTMAHEFAHSIQNGISKTFNADYKKLGYMDAYQEFITEYGSSKPGEHFADSMSKYIQTGEATPTFMDFLRSTGIL
jgi:hypothetical protein